MTTERRQLVAVGGAYAAQQFGYGALVTALPALRDRSSLSDGDLSLVMLGVIIGAACGSILAERVAVRWGSRQALVAALAVQGVALALVTVAVPVALLVPSLVLVGLGLGGIDASYNMQASLTEQRLGRPVLGRLYAAGTFAAIVATGVTAGALALGLPAVAALVVAVLLHATVAVRGVRDLDPRRAAHRVEERRSDRTPLPTGAIVAVGSVVFAAFVVDAVVSTWGTVLATDELRLADARTPLLYMTYLAASLVARLLTDRAVLAAGRVRVGVVAGSVGAVGCVVIAWSGAVPLVVLGFAAAGIASGCLVPLAFSRAGELVPGRSDEVIARVNLFNYAAAVLGGALPGVVAEVARLGLAFLLPAAALVVCIPLLRTLRRRVPS
ncbi:MFS transporter [Sanguibacter sp. HDW7]|uniref:MFS transporter n=1 Tax=Sanguibacter sp. HDW7 TaxID=2714931 RepID=UPI001409AFC1|nr:MFS transporter [Sanguibacter sp. HDW7]QIK84696.1 MFS transporter [Sanguibacter sp. HDW7]